MRNQFGIPDKNVLKESGITEIIIIVGHHLHVTIQQYFARGKVGVSIDIAEAAPMALQELSFYLKTLADKAFILYSEIYF